MNAGLPNSKRIDCWPVLTAVLISLAFSGVCASAQTSQPVPGATGGQYENDSIGHAPVSSGNTSSPSLLAPSAGMTDNALDIRRVALSLAIVLGLVFAIRWTMRWIFPAANVARSSQVMKVLSRSVIAPKQQLLLVKVGQRLVVVGDCGSQMNALTEITDPDEVAGLLGQLRSEPTERETRSMFAPILGKAQQRFDDPAPVADRGAETVAETGTEAESVELSETRNELSGLTDKIRLLSHHLGKAQ